MSENLEKINQNPYDCYINTADLLSAWERSGIPQLRDNKIIQQIFSIAISFNLLDHTIKNNTDKNPLRENLVVRAICKQIEFLAERLRNLNCEDNVLFELITSAHDDIEVSEVSDAHLEAIQFSLRMLEKIGRIKGLIKIEVAEKNKMVFISCIQKKDISDLYYKNSEHDDAIHKEDYLFVRVHQICEGVLDAFLHDIDCLKSMLRHNFLENVPRWLNTCAAGMMVYVSVIEMLAGMSIYQYAPLRVSLRDASGALSRRAQKRISSVLDLYKVLSDRMLRDGVDPFLVLLEENAKWIKIIREIIHLGKEVQSSMAAHARLVDYTVGENVYGTMGEKVLTLGEMSAHPVFKDLIKNIEDFTVYTNFFYADFSGIVTMDREKRKGLTEKYAYEVNRNAKKCDPDLMRKCVETYFRGITSRDVEVWLSSFSETGRFSDSKHAKPYVGHKELALFFKGFKLIFVNVIGHFRIIEYGNDYIVVAWEFKNKTKFKVGENDVEISFNGIESFYFDDSSKIIYAEADYNNKIAAEVIKSKYKTLLLDSVDSGGLAS